MELLKQIKNSLDLKIDYEKMKSVSIFVQPFNMELWIDIVVKDKELYFKMSTDSKSKYLIKINSIQDAEVIFKKYIKHTKHNQSVNKSFNMMNSLNNGIVMYNNVLKMCHQKKCTIFKYFFDKYDSNISYYAGIVNDFGGIENSCNFNEYLSNIPIILGTAHYNDIINPMVSVYRTLYSNSFIIIDFHNQIKIDKGYSPIFVRVCYSKIEKHCKKSFENIVKNCFYKKYPHDMPYDLIAALEKQFQLLDINDIQSALEVHKKNEDQNAINYYSLIKNLFDI